MTNVAKAINQQQSEVRENRPPYSVRSAEAAGGARAQRSVAPALRRLIRRRASALIELEKN